MIAAESFNQLKNIFLLAVNLFMSEKVSNDVKGALNFLKTQQLVGSILVSNIYSSILNLGI